MFDKKSINKITKDTIGAIQSTQVKTRSDEHLVHLTFLMKSGMDGMYFDGIPVRHGMAAMSFQEFKSFIMNKVRINKALIKDFRDICLVDVETDTIEDLFDALMYNVSLQVLVVWSYYRLNLSEMPRSIDGVGNAYSGVWDTSCDPDSAVERLIEWLNSGD